MPNNLKKFIKKNPKFVKGAKITAVVTGGVAVTAATGGIAGVAIAGAAAVAGTAAAGLGVTAAAISTATTIGVGATTYTAGKNKINKIVEDKKSLIEVVPYRVASNLKSEPQLSHKQEEQTQQTLIETFV